MKDEVAVEPRVDQPCRLAGLPAGEIRPLIRTLASRTTRAPKAEHPPRSRRGRCPAPRRSAAAPQPRPDRRCTRMSFAVWRGTSRSTVYPTNRDGSPLRPRHRETPSGSSAPTGPSRPLATASTEMPRAFHGPEPPGDVGRCGCRHQARRLSAVPRGACGYCMVSRTGRCAASRDR